VLFVKPGFDPARADAPQCDGSPRWTRTTDPLINSQNEPCASGTGSASCDVGADDGRGIGRSPAREALADPELAAVVESWNTLSVAVRAGILAMVQASQAECGK